MSISLFAAALSLPDFEFAGVNLFMWLFFVYFIFQFDFCAIVYIFCMMLQFCLIILMVWLQAVMR